MSKKMTPEQLADYRQSVIRIYEGELTAIGDMLNTISVPEKDEGGDALPPRGRVRWLINRYLALSCEAADAHR